ncbi:MAG TPA: hypothetical protein QGF58_18585 [Myxococcota bacterium]|nr:hypothetical protein [Myxococcota bacterium]
MLPMILQTMFAGRDGKVRIYAKKIRNKDTPVEERQNMAYWLAEDGKPDAILAMLGRFEMTYEHGMKDVDEKEIVENLVLELGEDAVEPLATFLRRCHMFARPMGLYERLAGPERARALILELLQVEYEKSELKPKKKKDLLIRLADFKGEDVIASAVRFLDDFDEGCRYGAVEVLLAQEEVPEIRDPLIAMLADPDEESGRLQHRIAEGAAARAWDLGEHAKAIGDRPPTNFKVVGRKLVSG